MSYQFSRITDRLINLEILGLPREQELLIDIALVLRFGVPTRRRTRFRRIAIQTHPRPRGEVLK